MSDILVQTWPGFPNLTELAAISYRQVRDMYNHYPAPHKTQYREGTKTLSLYWAVDSNNEFIDIVIRIHRDGQVQVGILTHLNHGLTSDSQYENLDIALRHVQRYEKTIAGK